MAKKRMVDGWLCWFWVDKDNVIQHFSSDRGRPPKGCKLVHADASAYKLRRGLDAPWLNSDGTTRLLAPVLPAVDVEPVKPVVGFLADASDGGYVPGDDEDDEPETDMADWDDRRLELEIEAEEKAKAEAKK